MTEAELTGWLRLVQAPGLGPVGARHLLATFGLPEQILEAGLPALERVVGPRAAAALRAPPDAALRELIARTLDWLAAPQRRLLTLADADYPATLLQITDPPPLLYAAGRVELLRRPRLLAIVGSRHPSAQGARDAEAFAAALAGRGVTVVSGLAQGGGAKAHQGALRALDDDPHAGSTVAVLGTGCDRVYPAAHRELAHRIAAQGLLLSEFALGTPPARGNFPRRNRLISGLARGVLVTEAAVHSGSLITARLAAEQGRDVFAVPGSIHNPLARGCHRLLREGARLVESVDDVLGELGWDAPAAAPPPPAPEAAPDALLAALGHDPVTFDELAVRTARDARWLGARLLELELAGQVARLPGGRFQRVVGN